MEEFLAANGTYILFGGAIMLMLLMHNGLWQGHGGGGCCGGAPRETERVDDPYRRTPDKSSPDASARGQHTGGCH